VSLLECVTIRMCHILVTQSIRQKPHKEATLYRIKSYRTLSVESFVSVWIALPSLSESVGQALHGSFAVPSSVPVTFRRGDLLRRSLKNGPITKTLN